MEITDHSSADEYEEIQRYDQLNAADLAEYSDLIRSALLLRDKSDFEKALVMLQSACDAAPARPDAFYHMANIYQKLQLYPKAALCYERVLSIAPGTLEVLNNLGLCFFRMDKFDDAYRCFTSCLEANSDFLGARRNLILVLLKQKRSFEAIEHSEHVASRESNDAGIHLTLARLYADHGNRIKSAGAYSKYLENSDRVLWSFDKTENLSEYTLEDSLGPDYFPALP